METYIYIRPSKVEKYSCPFKKNILLQLKVVCEMSDICLIILWKQNAKITFIQVYVLMKGTGPGGMGYELKFSSYLAQLEKLSSCCLQNNIWIGESIWRMLSSGVELKSISFYLSNCRFL